MANPDRMTRQPHQNNAAPGGLMIGDISNLKHLAEFTSDIIYRYRLSSPKGFDFINTAASAIPGFTLEEYQENPEGLFNRLVSEEVMLSLRQLFLETAGLSPVRFQLTIGIKEKIETEHIGIPCYDSEGNLIAIEGIARPKNTHQYSNPENISEFSQTTIHYLNQLTQQINQAYTWHETAQIIGNGLLELCNASHCILYELNEKNKLQMLWSDTGKENGYKELLSSLEQLLENSQPITTFTQSSSLTNESYSSCVIPLYSGSHLMAAAICSWNSPQVPILNQPSINLFTNHAALMLQNLQLSRELEDAYLQSILALAKTIDIRDAYTSDHSQRLMVWAKSLAVQMGCSPQETSIISWAALLHDIGKIGIPDNILNKPDELNQYEWLEMRKHPEIGADIVSNIKMMKSAVPYILFHHEHYDGKGYPNGLRGEQIPLGARILAVVDAYGAMIDRRVYRPARKPMDAILELKKQSGLQFDPAVVNAFIGTLPAPISAD